MPLTQHDARRDAQARLTYEPLVSNLAHVFMARMVSGKASAGDTQNSRPANKFLREKFENAELVKQLLKACNKEHDPQQFVDAADDNYALRQGFAHNKSDAWLKQTAEDLRTVGALDIFQNTHPFQCMIIEHMDAMLAVL